MSTRTKAPSILTAEGARRKTDRLVTTLTEAHELLIELWTGRAWEALEYPNWDAYCKAELSGLLAVKLPPAMRREAAEHMKSAGMSYRNIASPFGVSPAAIHADLARAKPKGVQKVNTPAPDQPPVDAPSLPQAPTHVQAARVIAQCGTEGGTTREVMDGLGWHQGPASVALSRAAKKRLVVPTGERRHTTGASIGFTVYRSAILAP